MVQTHHNFINGKWVGSNSDKKIVDINPANSDEIIGYFQQSDKEEIRKAILASERAFAKWREWPSPKRGALLDKVIAEMENQVDPIAEELTREQGKPLAEARGEIYRGIKEARFMIGEATRASGEIIPSEREGVLCYTFRQPIGVVGVITPWNFPFIAPLRKIVPALVAGNTVVFKPASLTPLMGVRITEIFERCGLPEGVLNLVTGSGSEVGIELIDNEAVKGISFTGSTEVGKDIAERASRRLTKVQLEMGGKNAVIILKGADLNSVVEEIIPAAFSCTGQRCTSISRVVVEEVVADDLSRLLVRAVEAMSIGNGLQEGINIGPLVSESQLERMLEYTRLGQEEGARILIGGQKLQGPEYDKGYFFAPTVIGDVKPEMRVTQEEIFGPIVCILTVSCFEEAVSVVNNVKYGLTSSIYTNDMSKAFRFVEKVETGMTHINMPTISEAHLPFGGIKESGVGSYSVGSTAMDFFTNLKVVYLKHKAKEGCGLDEI